jgi:hypothetical protein
MVNSKPNWRHRIPKVIEHQNSISSFEMNGREKSGFPGDTATDEASQLRIRGSLVGYRRSSRF